MTVGQGDVVTEDITAVQAKASDIVNYVGVASIEMLMAKSQSILSKIAFNTYRGYTFLGIKYGMGIINSCFDTLHIVVLPKNESSTQERAIFSLPRGQRLNFSPDMCDFDDTFLLIGVSLRESFTQATFGQAETDNLYGQAIPCEVFYSSLMKTAEVSPLDESVKIRKPDMSKFMYTKNKAITGKVSARNAEW